MWVGASGVGGYCGLEPVEWVGTVGWSQLSGWVVWVGASGVGG